jgi:uncharacterized protein (TIGR03435 family)
MLRAIPIASLLALTLSGQPAFEVASIKTYPAGAPFPPGSNGIRISPDGVAWRFARLQNCISWAYDIPGRVIGPEWITDRYDIVAKASGPVSKDQLKRMAQTLLEDRFKLKVHREMQELPVVALIVAKNGSKNLQQITPADSFKYEPANGNLVFQGSMKDFAAILGNSPPYGVREQIVDQTGISGWFDLTLDVKNFDVNDPSFGGKYDEMQSAAFAFLSAALERKYGLKLEHRKVSLESLVVDSGNKTPTENE